MSAKRAACFCRGGQISCLFFPRLVECPSERMSVLLGRHRPSGLAERDSCCYSFVAGWWQDDPPV